VLNRFKRGLAIAAVLGFASFATALVPRVEGVALVQKTEVRAANPPRAIRAVPMVATGELSIVNYVHRAISVRGILADQAFRLFAALVFLAVYSTRSRSLNRIAHDGMAAFAILGAAGCLSDFVSYATIGGVVDWIGVNGRSAFAPSDLFWALAPVGMFLSAMVGIAICLASGRRSERIAAPAWSAAPAICAD
jgi:hypothetical protein